MFKLACSFKKLGNTKLLFESKKNGKDLLILNKSAPDQKRGFAISKSTELKGSPITWKSLGVTFVVGGALLAFYLQKKNQNDKEREEKLKGVGKPAIGGPWTLVNHHGAPVTNADFKNQYLFIYFGFTHCPDICPTELKKMSNVVDIIAKRNPKLRSQFQPLFITLDPLRDSVGKVREYCKEFHPDLLGLTGTPAQVDAICKAFRVYHMRANELHEDDYLVDHSIILYLVDKESNFMTFFGNSMEPEDIVKKINKEIAEVDEEFRPNMFEQFVNSVKEKFS